MTQQDRRIKADRRQKDTRNYNGYTGKDRRTTQRRAEPRATAAGISPDRPSANQQAVGSSAYAAALYAKRASRQ